MHTRSHTRPRPIAARFSAGTLATLLSAAVGLAGCGGSGEPQPEDMAAPDLAVVTTPDLSVPAADLHPAADLKPLEDMRLVTDSAPPAPTVTGLPPCTETNINADKLFPTAKTHCANGGCHATGAGGLTIKDAATLKSALVGVAARQTTIMPRVQAGNVDQSYLIYKLADQQPAAMGSGVLMPKGGSRLADPDLCQFVVWVKEGAK